MREKGERLKKREGELIDGEWRKKKNGNIMIILKEDKKILRSKKIEDDELRVDEMLGEEIGGEFLKWSEW